MPTMKSFADVNKFRLFVIVGFSILTSLSLSMKDNFWMPKDVMSAILQAGIAAFAYMQCPTIPKKKETN
jgi:hypothetical protein